MRRTIIQKLLFIFFFFALINSTDAKEKKTRIVIFPFENHWDSGEMRGVERVIHNELIRTGYFTVVDDVRTFKFVKQAVINNFFKVDNINVGPLANKANVVDMFSGFQWVKVAQVARKLDADYGIKGALTQFGEKYRADIEVIDVKTEIIDAYSKEKDSVHGFVGECESKEKIPEMMELLAEQIESVCKSENVQEDADAILRSYRQGMLTYQEALLRLKQLSSEMPDELSVHCALFSHYMEQPENVDRLIEEGEEIIHLFHTENDEHIKCLSFLGIDLFYELANAYKEAGKLQSAIDVYTRAIQIYPMNHVKYYKQLGVLYLLFNNLADSINVLERVVSLDPSDFESRYNLGMVYDAKGDLPAAIDQFRQCLKYGQNENERTRAQEMIGRLSEKMEMLEE